MPIDIRILQEWIFNCRLDRHESRLTPLALQVFQNLIITTGLFFVLSEYSVYTVNGGITYELLKVRVLEKVSDIAMEDYVVG